MDVTLLNHASLAIDCEGFRLVTDPWLSGRALNDSWALAAKSPCSLTEANASAVWVSHEHPDHFSPHEFRNMPEHLRPQVTVYVQPTRDGKIAAYLRRLGFSVCSPEPWTWFSLAPGLDAMIFTFDGFDSGLMLRDEEITIVNTNDVPLDQPTFIDRLRETSGRIDVLAAQHAAAQWSGNRGDEAMINAAKVRARDKILRQVESLRPNWCLMFAGFHYFCHEENDYLNDALALPEELIEDIKASAAAPVVLAPGQSWTANTPHDPTPGCKFWSRAYSSAREQPPVRSRFVSFDRLLDKFNTYRARIQEQNDWDAIMAFKQSGRLPPAIVRIEDISITASFDLVGGLKAGGGEPDVTMSSDSLAHLLDHGWGRGTLFTGGRVQVNPATVERFYRQTEIAYANGIGQRFPEDITPGALACMNKPILRMLSRLESQPSVTR